jgi:hypothetical protein
VTLLALLTLALLTLLALALLALALLTGLGQVASGVLQLRRGPREVSIDVDILAGVLEGLAEPIERLASRLGVALGDALCRVAESGPGCAVRLARGRLHAGERLGDLASLGLGHLVELVTELLQVVGGLLRVAILVGILVPGGRPRQRAVERRERGRPLFVRRVQLGADVRLDRRDAGEVQLQVVGPVP